MGEEKKAVRPFGVKQCFQQCSSRLERLDPESRRRVLNALTAMIPLDEPVAPDPRQTTIPGAFEDPFTGEQK